MDPDADDKLQCSVSAGGDFVSCGNVSCATEGEQVSEMHNPWKYADKLKKSIVSNHCTSTSLKKRIGHCDDYWRIHSKAHVLVNVEQFACDGVFPRVVSKIILYTPWCDTRGSQTFLHLKSFFLSSDKANGMRLWVDHKTILRLWSETKRDFHDIRYRQKRSQGRAKIYSQCYKRERAS